MQVFLNKYIGWIFIASFAFNVITFSIVALGSIYSCDGLVAIFQWVLFAGFFLQAFICIASLALIGADIITRKRALNWWLGYFFVTLAIILLIFKAMPRC